MRDDEKAIVAYWRADNLFNFSKKACLEKPGKSEQEEPRAATKRGSFRVQFGIVGQMCWDKKTNKHLYVIVRDPPSDTSNDRAGDMNAFGQAAMKILLASDGCPRIRTLLDKGGATFYYVPPWTMEHIEAAFSARLIDIKSQTAGAVALADTVMMEAESKAANTIADPPPATAGKESTKTVEPQQWGGTEEELAAMEGRSDCRKAEFRRLRQLYESESGAIDIEQGGDALSQQEIVHLENYDTALMWLVSSFYQHCIAEESFLPTTIDKKDNDRISELSTLSNNFNPIQTTHHRQDLSTSVMTHAPIKSSSSSRMSLHQLPIVSAMMVVTMSCCMAFTPDIDHRAIAGLWKLTPKKDQLSSLSLSFPMKEFTVYPKIPQIEATLDSQGQELLLMLKEDGSFQQYAEDDKEDDEQVHIPDTLKFHDDDDEVLDRFLGRIQGQWDFVDGKLILAADRPEFQPEDTLLVGTVVATSEEALPENPTVQFSEDQIVATTDETQEDISPASSAVDASSTADPDDASFDTHLSVPKGRVNVGKFFYPKKHPSFFEQPMFAPKSKGKFELKQVLGSLNAQQIQKEDEIVEKFRTTDFHDKKFLVTSHPIGQRKAKGNKRWSIKYNKYVEDPISKEAKKAADEEAERPANIRVMEVHFFANNTFATTSGLGDSILRGKYHIIGHERDQLWMQVWRFGFGRGVSGSVFSEGRMLTKEDEKTYWGEIMFEDEVDQVEACDSSSDESSDAKDRKDPSFDSERRLYVKGSVIYGYGLEPQPVGRFIMTETTDSEIDLDDEEEDDDEEDELPKWNTDDDMDDFVDWSNAFQ